MSAQSGGSGPSTRCERRTHTGADCRNRTRWRATYREQVLFVCGQHASSLYPTGWNIERHKPSGSARSTS